MTNYGFVRVAAATPNVKVADCEYNTSVILEEVGKADKQAVAVVVFPELSLTSYTVGDLTMQRSLLDAVVYSLTQICEFSENVDTVIIVGAQIEITNNLYNTAVVIHRGEIKGIVPKTFIPNYKEFYEKRWFAPAAELSKKMIQICGQEVPVGTDLIFDAVDFRFAIEICEDLWTTIPPSSFHALHGADVIFNLSASNEVAGKSVYRKNLVSQQAARCVGAYVYSSAGVGESTTDTVFSGHSIIAENGIVLRESKRFATESQLIIADVDIERLRSERLIKSSFSTLEYKNVADLNYRYIFVNRNCKAFDLNRSIEKTPFVPAEDQYLNERCEEIFSIQTAGLTKRLQHTGIKHSVIGISGGLDSTLALLVLVLAYDRLRIGRENIIGITMPGFGTTDRTYDNAIALMKALGITMKEISIRDAVLQHFDDIEHDANVHDVTYENAQARERTQILMDYANKINALVIGTGDLSELALGWCTYNGDHMSMYGVNAGIPKTLVQALVKWVANTQVDDNCKTILHDVVNTPVSPELLPVGKDGKITQKTEDAVGPYILHDFFIYYMLRFGFTPAKIYFLAQHAFSDTFDNATILKWMKVFYRRFFTQQFKRSCMPDGPKVGSVNLSPRGDWRMPSDASFNLWMKQIEELKA